MILLAILLPPIAQLFIGKIFSALICLILMVTLIGWPIAAIWAVAQVLEHKAKRRERQQTDELSEKVKEIVSDEKLAAALKKALDDK